jgi:hypothetical protein
MKSIYNKLKFFATGIIIPAVLFSTGCKKLVELDPPQNKINASTAYQTDGTATAAVVALYNYGIFGIMGSLQQAITLYGGVSADELHYTLTTTPEITEIENNLISIGNGTNASFWYNAYAELLAANSAITGITASTTLTPAVRSQLLGEAKFFRAWVNFYLVNYYGGVPLTGNDPLANAYLPRSSADAVWTSIIADLRDAQGLLPATYVGTLKSRVNQHAVTALLARVYLYRKDYVNAEAQASQVISSGTYTLTTTPNVFINSSTETILQFATFVGASTFGPSYRTATPATNVAPPTYTLTSNIANSFESGDSRKTNWVDSTISGSKFYRVNKYKIFTATSASMGNEFNVVLRLAEQYLIRAEARAQTGNLSGAAADLNVIRNRAGLSNLSAANSASSAALLNAVAQERKVELFGEYGHRWLDLLRTGQANAVIGPLKPTTWNATRSVLFPIPDLQRQQNPALTQNPGY